MKLTWLSATVVKVLSNISVRVLGGQHKADVSTSGGGYQNQMTKAAVQMTQGDRVHSPQISQS